VRALTPHVGAYVEPAGAERLGVRRAAVAVQGGVAPGELTARDGALLFGTVAGALELLEVQPAGKRPMDAASYLRGHAVQPTGQRQ
jgi:methionyl-tRNA formyltransferase